MTNAPLYERNHPVSTPALHVVTAEDEATARKAIADLDRIERLVTTVLVVLGIGGLIFTAVNVTVFATEHDVHWGIAWMLDPLVSVSLLATLYIDGKLAAHGYRPNGWPFVLRWFAGLSTWLMNCWGALYPDAKFTGWPDRPDPAGLLLHSVIPFLVIVLAEAGAGYRRFSTRQKVTLQATVTRWKDQEDARRRADRAEAKRIEDDRRAAAEADRKRAADLAADRERAEIDSAKAREASEAKARETRAEAEAKARSAEQARKDEETRLGREAEAREQQARINRENAEHAAELERQRILTEAEATAVKVRAEADAKAAEQARIERRKAAEARRDSAAEATAIPAAETTAIPDARTAISTAISASRPTAKTQKPTAILDESDDVRGAEAKRKQIEEATFEAAVLIFTGQNPTRKDFAARYGRAETWGRDRYADADRLLSDDADFSARVLAEAETRTDQNKQVPA